MSGLTEQQVHELLHRLDAVFDSLMDRAEKRNDEGAHALASGTAMKAHGVLKGIREVQYAAGIDPYVWEQVHRRERTDAAK